MIAVQNQVAPRSKPSPKLNRSSRTKTSRKNRKKDKRTLTVNEVRKKVQAMIESDELLLRKVFDDATIQAILDEISGDKSKRRDRIYTPQVALSLFVQQVLTKDAGCKEMVTLLNKQRKAQQLSAASTNTTSYCQARAKLPLQLAGQEPKAATLWVTDSWRTRRSHSCTSRRQPN